MKTKLLTVLVQVVLIFSATLIFAGDKVILPTDQPVPREFLPDNTKPGGVVIGPAMGRAFHYGGRQSLRDQTGRLHAGWEDPDYDFNLISHSTDSLGFSWIEAYDPVKAYGVEEPGVGFRTEIDRTLMPKLAMDPVTGYLYMMPFYRINAGERYKTGISRSMDNGETWSHYVDLGSRINRPTEEVSWGTFTIGSNQIMHIVYSKDNQDIMYTRADLNGLAVIDSIKFFRADGTTPGDEPVSFVPSGVVFQGTIVLDRNDDPHIVFSGDGGADTFGDKTPYHIYYKTAAASWGPIPPQQLMAELELIWGMPEMVFDVNNRGYYFFCNNDVSEMVFGTWEKPVDAASNTDFGTLNASGTMRDNSGEGARSLTVDIYPNIEITTDDYLYLPNADVDDANDIVYLVANTNGYNGGTGGDIVVLQLLNATTYAGAAPDAMDWTLMRWITDDGVGLGDVGPDVIYDPSSSTLDIFWAGAGPLTQEAQYFPAHIPKSAIDGQALSIAIVLPERWPLDKIDVNEGDILAIVGVLKNNGTAALPPMPVTASIETSDGTVVFSEDFISIPLGPGQKTAEIEFGSWVVAGSRDDFSLKLKVNVVGDEATFNDQVGTAFFVYPGPGDYLNFETFQDTNFTNFPTFDSTGNQIVLGGWFPAAASTGGWTVIDSSNGTFGDARDDYISTWIVDPSVTYEEGNGPPISRDPFALVRHMRGVRGDTLFGDIAHATLSDSAYAQAQNEVLLSPVYTITGTDDAYALEWDDGISGTDGEFNFPIYAFVDYTTDGGTTWNMIYHRSDMQGEATSIASSGEFLYYDLTSGLTGQTSVQFRFWWRNPNNDGGFATWSVDNIYLTTFGGTVANEPGGRSLPAGYALSQNYPNPFNPVTRIRYEVPVASEVRIDLYNLLGQRVATLVNGHVTAGRHEVHFNAKELASGVYFYRLVAPNQVITRKMLVLK